MNQTRLIFGHYSFSFRKDESKIVDSEEVRPGIILDFDDRDQVVGIEILRVKQRIPRANLKQIQFEVA